MSQSDIILRLQLRKRRHRFLSRVVGDFAQKGQRKAKLKAIPVAGQYAKSMQDCDWKYLPKGKVAVNMHFFSDNQSIPALHNLVKFYLDPLKGVAFKDDGQVYHLTASCLRAIDLPSSRSKKADSVHVSAERLSDYTQRFNTYFTLLSDGRFDDLIGDDDNEYDELESAADSLRESVYEVFGFTPEQNEKLRRFDLLQYQQKLLRINKVTGLDGPGRSPLAKYFPDNVAQFRELQPFSIDLGDLPRIGESKQYQERILNSVRSFKSRGKYLNEIITPVELDVQVTPRALRLGKDLDNIMRDICPVIQNELLRGDAYVHGYRAYVTSRLKPDSPGSIRLKLLPQWCIGEFESAKDRFLDEAADRLD